MNCFILLKIETILYVRYMRSNESIEGQNGRFEIDNKIVAVASCQRKILSLNVKIKFELG